MKTITRFIFYFLIIKESLFKFYNNISIPIFLKYISIPYISGLSEQLNKIDNKYKFKAAFKTNINVHFFIKL